MMRRELLHQRCGQPVPHHQEEGDHDVMVSLVVVELGVALEDMEDDIDELLLQSFPLVIRHPCGNSRGVTSVTQLCHLPVPAVGARVTVVCKESTCAFTNLPDPKGCGAQGKVVKLAEKTIQRPNAVSQNCRIRGIWPVAERFNL